MFSKCILFIFVSVFIFDLIVAEYGQTTYDMSPICNGTSYGELLENLVNINNIIVCGRECRKRLMCVSFSYDDVTKKCVLNKELHDGTTVPGCTSFVTYGAQKYTSTSTPGQTSTSTLGTTPTSTTPISTTPTSTMPLPVCNNSCTLPINNIRLCAGGGASVCLPHTGRVEVFNAGTWGTVSDHYWEDLSTLPGLSGIESNAHVVCKTLGFTTGFSLLGGMVASGTGTIWMDDVRCEGNEAHLFTCPFDGFGIINCDHTEDVGVTCA